MSENNNFKSRIRDLMHTFLAQNRYTCTAFLSPEEQDVVAKTMKEEAFYQGYFYGGSESAIRRIAVFGSEEELGYPFDLPVRVISITPVSEKFAQELSHRDYLGALMNLGIDRSTTGDIVIKGKRAWLFCLENIAQYIMDNLTCVSKTNVRCSLSDMEIPEIKPQFQEIRVNVAAQRMDAVIAALLKLSRTKAQDLIRLERVFANGSMVKNGGSVLKQGDVLVIRGFGKYIYDGIEHRTKKDRLYVKVRKYV